MTLEKKQGYKFIGMLLSIFLGFILMLVPFQEFSVLELIVTKLTGILLLGIGAKMAKNIFQL